jgi:hypothetical protein
MRRRGRERDRKRGNEKISGGNERAVKTQRKEIILTSK